MHVVDTQQGAADMFGRYPYPRKTPQKNRLLHYRGQPADPHSKDILFACCALLASLADQFMQRECSKFAALLLQLKLQARHTMQQQ
jgi:hypothetical protein